MKPAPSFTFLAAWLTSSVAFGQTGAAPASGATPETLQPIEVVARAENGKLERLVDTEIGLPSKLPYSIFETPRAVETVTRDQFEQWGAQSLADTARYVSGVQGSYYGLDLRQDFVRIRGLQSINYRDGLQYNYNFYNNTAVEQYSLEQVDFIKGPASVLFGRGTVGGTVNSTSKIARRGAESEVMMGYGTFDRFQLGVDYNVALNKSETLFLRMVGYYRDSDTYVDYVNDDSQFLMPSLTWEPSEDTRLSFLVNWQENDAKPSLMFYPNEATNIPGQTLTNDTYIGEPGVDRYHTDQASATLIFDHKFNDCYSISSTLRYLDSSAEYAEHTIIPPELAVLFPVPALPPGSYHRILYGADSDTDVLSGNIVFNAKQKTGPLSHDIRVGTDFTRADRDRYTLPPNLGLFGLPYVYAGPIDLFNPVYGGPFSVALPDRTDYLAVTEEMMGGYVSDRIQWGNLIVSAGARFDSYELESNKQVTEKQEEWTFDFGAMYQFANGVSPYYSYAESFEPQGINTTTNTAFKPKEGSQHEIGVKWMPREETLLVASYFQIEEENRILSGPLVSTQAGSVEVDGAEFSIRQRYNDFYLMGGYTYLDTANNDLDGSPELSGVPKHQASAWVTYMPEAGPLAGFRAGFGVRFTGRTNDGRDIYETGSNTLFDAMVGYTYKSLDLQLTVSNLFDRQYVQTRDTTEQIPGAPLTTTAFLGQDRAINLVARYRF